MRGIFFFVAALLAAVVIQATSQVSVELKLDWRSDTMTNGQLFWSQDSPEFTEPQSVRFDVKQGTQTVRVKLPSHFRWLRLDPVDEPGKIRISGARFHSTLLPFDYLEFDSPASFQAWTPDPGRNLRSPVLKEDALEFESVDRDPYLISPPLYGLALSRWLQILAEALLVAGAALFATPRLRPRVNSRKLALATAALATLAVVALGAWRLWQQTRWFSPDGRDVSIPGYDLSFYDMWGRPLSTRRGELALVIDPFTIYRNYPNQAGERFKIDENGFRASGKAKPGAATAFVLGGSTTFGLAAPSDEDTFVHRMSSFSPKVHYANAAVVGFQSGQELALMVHHLDRFDPKLYLVVDGWNDIQQNLHDPHGDDLGFNHSTFDLFQEHLFKLASLQASGLPGARAPVSVRGETRNFEEKVIRTYLENVEKMSAFAKSRHTSFALAIQPIVAMKKHLSEFEERRSEGWRDSQAMKRAVRVYSRMARETLALCSRIGIPCIDLNSDPEFRSTSETFFADDCHLTPSGNRWVAATLGAFLSAKNRANSNP